MLKVVLVVVACHQASGQCYDLSPLEFNGITDETELRIAHEQCKYVADSLIERNDVEMARCDEITTNGDGI